jgi:hypothetical protein
MSMAYHIPMKKEYPAGVQEDLCKNDAISLIPEEEAIAVPEWQIKEVQRRMVICNNNPESMINEDVFLEMLHEE